MGHSDRMIKKSSQRLRFVSILESKLVNKIQNVTYKNQNKAKG